MRFRVAWPEAVPEKSDRVQRQWYLGPVGVRPDRQGMGIGSQMMEYYCRQLDSVPAVAYLDTDKAENVAFYQRFGFDVIGEKVILGVTVWQMRRSPGCS